MIRVIIAGSREFYNKELLYKEVDNILSDIYDEKIEIISGHCRGADSIGEQYALDKKIQLKVFPPYWKIHGKKAGYIRNIEMAQYASEIPNAILIAFPIGESKGTRMMINIAKEHGIKTFIIEN